jgi:hypothetical protein
MINDDADTFSFLPPNTSLFQFCQSESTAFSDFSVISDSLGTDSWAEQG